PKAKRIEFRCPDPTANPYLAFAAMLMAGLDGIAKGLDPGAPADFDLFEESRGDIPQVPDSLGGALDAPEADHEFLLQGGVFGDGRQRGVTHEYRGRVFESRFLPKAMLVFIVEDEIGEEVVAAIVDSARSGNEAGDGIVWTSSVSNVMHNRTGKSLEEVEVGG